jgi:hypothetical protein
MSIIFIPTIIIIPLINTIYPTIYPTIIPTINYYYYSYPLVTISHNKVLLL